jgi:ABC-type transport system involved in Fe-S cluster assembly fused permease/ATPase subunit
LRFIDKEHGNLAFDRAFLQELAKERLRIFIFFARFDIKLFHNKAEEGIR